MGIGADESGLGPWLLEGDDSPTHPIIVSFQIGRDELLCLDPHMTLEVLDGENVVASITNSEPHTILFAL